MDKILFFFTGLSKIPVFGFDPVPALEFDSQVTYPKSSVCLHKLTLPSQYKEYVKLKEVMNISVTMHGGFGQY